MPPSFRLACFLFVSVSMLFGQGLNTQANQQDWEEINFEFNSSVLSDGFPSLLRLAELLQKNPDYKVTLEGNTDIVGSARYNEKLSRLRGETVKAFLVKYGARDAQISVVARGKATPKVPNSSKEGRFMNRRVTMVLRDAAGKVVSAGGVAEAIRSMPDEKAAKCCEEVLKRLDRLESLLAGLKDLKAENERLRQDVDALKAAQGAVAKQVEALPRPPERAEVQEMMTKTADEAVEKAKPSRFSLLGLNAGPTLSSGPMGRFGGGNITFSGRGRYFAPFGKTQMSAVQAEGEYLYYRDRQEGQFDLGLVNRHKGFQLGLFNSVKHVGLTDIGGGTLAQGAVTADFLFSRGRVGLFGTKGYLDNRVISRTPVGLSGNLILENYLKIVDQIGASTTVGAWDDAYFDANFGALFRRGGTNRPGGMLRLVQPLNRQIAFTVEAGLNETMVGPKNTGRLAFGIQFGNWLRPKEYAKVDHPVPVDVPRLRYELLSRTVRTGNEPPHADAGPDQIGVAAGTVTLDASASYDPDGDPITFAWSQLSGPTVALSAANAAQTSFTAAEGQVYRFRVTVRDSAGAQASDTITVTSQAATPLRVLLFNATPATVTSGQQATLNWQVQNAESVEISTLGAVNPQGGSVAVVPSQTTTYTLTARGKNGESVTATTTVTVSQAAVNAPVVIEFTATPAEIAVGESSTLRWDVQGATEVTISGIGTVNARGIRTVSPGETTTYTLTARNASGQATGSTLVRVLPPVRILSFNASKTTVNVGETVTLTWTTENAGIVSVADIPVSVNGSRNVTLTAPGTVTYMLVASGNRTRATAQVTVTAVQPSTSGNPLVCNVVPAVFTTSPAASLDGSQIRDLGGSALTYQWAYGGSASGVAVANPSSASTAATLPSGAYGSYAFTVTATNAAGKSCTAQTVVTYQESFSPRPVEPRID